MNLAELRRQTVKVLMKIRKVMSGGWKRNETDANLDRNELDLWWNT